MIAPKQTRRRSPGAILIVLLAVFSVVVALSVVWTRGVLANHQRQRLTEERVQARWLAEAGVRRAAARLSADPAYRGETWKISARQLPLPGAASVAIHVEPAVDADADSPFRLEAHVTFTRGAARLRETKTVVYNPHGESGS